MSLEKLKENKILNEKINDVYEKIKNKDYVEAYDSIRNIIDLINQKFILKNYEMNLDDASPIPASKAYFNKDDKLLNYMVTLNDEYNTIDYADMRLEDVELLISYLECIYTYMLKNYGEFM